jgi:hypothetical protein
MAPSLPVPGAARAKVARAIVDALQAVDRIDGLREVFQEQVVALELGLDGFEHRPGPLGRGPDEADEPPVCVHDGPDAGDLGQRSLPAAARHGLGELATMKDRRLDLGDDLQVVAGPGQRERCGKVRLAEAAEIQFAGQPAGRVDRVRQRGYLPARGRQAAVPRSRRFPQGIVAGEALSA